MNDSILSKHIQQTKKRGIRIYYKNCASRWLLTHRINRFVLVLFVHYVWGRNFPDFAEVSKRRQGLYFDLAKRWRKLLKLGLMSLIFSD